MTDAPFVSGIELSGSFFDDLVRERADAVLGAERYAAALLGPGSEVLGLDSEVSTDHDWGPRVVLVVAESDVPRADSLRVGLPDWYRGHSLKFGENLERKPWTQPIYAVTVEALFMRFLGFNPLRGVSLLDWLSAPSNNLLMLTSGRVFHDGPGELTEARRVLHWYPDDLWVWMLGCQWNRISQEHAFVGRAAQADDALGGRVLTARLARDTIRLAFLVERRFAPYSKWLAKALRRLRCGPGLTRHLEAALATADPHDRQMSLAHAYAVVGEEVNALWPDLEVDCSPRGYFTRPSVIGPAGEFTGHLLDRVADPALNRLPKIGAADQVLDSTDAGWEVSRPMYEALLTAPD